MAKVPLSLKAVCQGASGEEGDGDASAMETAPEERKMVMIAAMWAIMREEDLISCSKRAWWLSCQGKRRWCRMKKV